MRASIVKVVVMLAATAMVAAPARAQVGYDPSRSPYLDLEYHQEIGLYAGRYLPTKDPAGVSPRGGMMFGAHYEWNAGGSAAYLTADLAHIASERTILDAAKPPATRDLGSKSWPLYTADFGLGLGLPGTKSWHHLVPLVKTGVGFVSDMRGRADTSGFKFGTRFAFTWGAGVKWVPGGRWQVRADWTNRLNTVAYPPSYYGTSTGGTPILSLGQSKSVWTNNAALTLGLSYLYSR